MYYRTFNFTAIRMPALKCDWCHLKLSKLSHSRIQDLLTCTSLREILDVDESNVDNIVQLFLVILRYKNSVFFGILWVFFLRFFSPESQGMWQIMTAVSLGNEVTMKLTIQYSLTR
jgi:hypothetical protein